MDVTFAKLRWILARVARRREPEPGRDAEPRKRFARRRFPRGARPALPGSLALAMLMPLIAWLPGSAQGASRRQTTDWQADLVAVLLQQSMLETAEALCARHFEQAEPQSEDAARWAIRWSAVRATTLLAARAIEADQIEQAKAPVAGLLQAYPDHPRQLWLRMQQTLVDDAAARQAAIAHAVTRHRAARQAEALDRIAAALRQWETLERETRDALAEVASGRDATAGRAAEWLALQQQLGRHRVAALLLRSHLFPAGSPNAIAAASQAVTAAEEVLERMQTQAALRPELLQLQAEALVRSGDPEAARTVLGSLRDLAGGGLPPQALALQIRLDTTEDPAAAEQALQTYYGSDPLEAPRSIEMDLARLHWLLHRPATTADPETANTAGTANPRRSAEVADWLEGMEQRGGRYARRRGEAAALQQLRGAADGSDVRLLAAEAAKRLREEDQEGATDLLVQAAEAAGDPELALRYAQQAAGLLLRLEQPLEAAEILRRTAQSHPQSAAAPQAHLQAVAVRYRGMQQAKAIELPVLQDWLEEHLTQWPRAETREQVLPWLLQLYEANGAFAAGARLIGSDPAAEATTWQHAGQWWRKALRSAATAEAAAPLVDEALASLQQGLAPADRGAVAGEEIWRIATLFGSRAQLQAVQSRGIPTAEAETPVPRFLESLRRFRLEGRPADSLTLEGLAEHPRLIADALQRLWADGATRPRDRRRIGAGMLRLLAIAEADAPPTDRAEEALLRMQAALWAGETDAALEQLDTRLASVSGADEAAVLRQAARRLSEASDPAARRRAVTCWNRLAAGIPQGTTAWHEAKLAAAKLLVQLGEREQAKQLVQFVLITRPPEDPELRARYEAIVP